MVKLELPSTTGTEAQPGAASDINAQSAIVGRTCNFRTTIAERLADPPANNTHTFAVATKHDVLATIVDSSLGLN